MSDPYQVLGVARGANEAEVKKAYRRLASQLHPDKNPGNPEAEERLKEVNRAYERIQSGDVGGSGFNPDFARSWEGGDFHSEDLFSIFANLGGFGRRSPRTALQFEVPLTFQEALSGIAKRIEFSRRSACTACAGLGPARRGQCSSCRGEGFVDIEDEAAIHFPRGVDTGQAFRVRSQKGCEVIGVAKVEQDPRWSREGLDLSMVIHVALPKLSRLEPIHVITPYAKLEFAIPAGAVLGTPMRFQKQGVRTDLGEAGDLVVRFLVEVPDAQGRCPRSEAYLQNVANWSPLTV